MNLSFKLYLKQFTLLVGVLFGIHILLYRAFSAVLEYKFSTLVELYVFLIFLSVAHFFALRWLFGKWPKYSGFIFTGLSLLKMVVSVLYLIPMIIPSNTQSVPVAISFMIIYMFFLAYEVTFLAKSMGKNH